MRGISTSNITGMVAPKPVEPIASNAGGGGASFGDALTSALEQVDGFRVQAEASADRMLRGEPEELHQVILAGQRAEIAFEAFLQVRNKAVQAYQEILRMPL